MGHCYTDYIDIKSGVKHGGIIFPQLYNVYADDLISEESGCKIRDISCGVVFYADDIILLGGSRRKMQRIIYICYDYGMINSITFNLRRVNSLQFVLLNTSVFVNFS